MPGLSLAVCDSQIELGKSTSDIAYAVHQCIQFLEHPKQSHTDTVRISANNSKEHNNKVLP